MLKANHVLSNSALETYLFEQAVIMIVSFTSNFFATIAALCNKHATSSLKCGQLCLGGAGKKSHIVTFYPPPQIKLSHLDHEIFKGTYLNRVTVQV